MHYHNGNSWLIWYDIHFSLNLIFLVSNEICNDLLSISDGSISYIPPHHVSATLPNGKRYVGTIETCSPGYQLVGGSMRVVNLLSWSMVKCQYHTQLLVGVRSLTVVMLDTQWREWALEPVRLMNVGLLEGFAVNVCCCKIVNLYCYSSVANVCMFMIVCILHRHKVYT